MTSSSDKYNLLAASHFPALVSATSSLVQKLDASSLNSDWMKRGKALATLLASSAFALV